MPLMQMTLERIKNFVKHHQTRKYELKDKSIFVIVLTNHGTGLYCNRLPFLIVSKARTCKLRKC